MRSKSFGIGLLPDGIANALRCGGSAKTRLDFSAPHGYHSKNKQSLVLPSFA